MVKYYPPILRVHLKKIRKDLSNDSYATFFCVFFFYSDFLYKAYVVGTHLNRIDKSMRFKWVPKTYGFNLKSGCNLKTAELLLCAYRNVCGN